MELDYKRLSERRREIGMSIEELVERSGVPKGTVTKIITGVTENPGIETLKAITYALGLTLEDLDKTNQPVTVDGLTDNQERFIWLYRQLGEDGIQLIDSCLSLSPSNRRIMIGLAKLLLQEQAPPSAPPH